MITLSAAGVTAPLHPDLYWSDEFSWSKVERASSRTVTGARIVQIGEKVGGRPITLGPEGDNSGWIPRATLDQLKTWADTPGLTLTLNMRGQNRTVEFESLEARPLVHFNDVQPGDYYLVTLRLTEV